MEILFINGQKPMSVSRLSASVKNRLTVLQLAIWRRSLSVHSLDPAFNACVRSVSKPALLLRIVALAMRAQEKFLT